MALETSVENIQNMRDFLATMPTELTAGGSEDFTVCRCKIHVGVAHGIVGGSGCAAKAAGRHGAVRAAMLGIHHACAENEGTKRVDQEFVDLILDYTGETLGYVSDGSVTERFTRGDPRVIKDFGAGYCFQLWIRATGRMRAARTLGPLCLIADWARAGLVLGQVRMKKLKLVRLPEDVGGHAVYHVVQDNESKGQSAMAGVELMRDIVSVLKQDSHARVGADYSEKELVEMLARVRAGGRSSGPIVSDRTVHTNARGVGGIFGVPTLVQKWPLGLERDRVERVAKKLSDVGIVLPEDSWGDVAVVTVASAAIPDAWTGARARAGVLADVGDAMLTLLACSQVAANEGVKEDCSRARAEFSNVKLARLLSDVPCDALFSPGGLPVESKGRADMLEGLVGVVATYLPIGDVIVLGKYLGALDSSF